MISLNMIPFLGKYFDIAILILRIVFGLIFLIHGLQKIRDLKENAKNFEIMGFRPGILWGTIVALGETFAGLIAILGLFTPLVGLYLAIEMLVAIIWKIAKKYRFIGGLEFDLLLFAISLILLTTSGGIFSLDVYWGLL